MLSFCEYKSALYVRHRCLIRRGRMCGLRSWPKDVALHTDLVLSLLPVVDVGRVVGRYGIGSEVPYELNKGETKKRVI